MILLDLFNRHSGKRKRWVVLATFVGGLLGTGIVTVANFALASDRTTASFVIGLAFLAALGILFTCNRWASRAIVEIFEDVQRGLRAELAERLRGAPLRTVEQIGTDHGHAIGELTFISTATTQVVSLIQDGAFLTCVTFVFASISGKAMAIWLFTAGMIAWWLVPRVRRLGRLQNAQSGRWRALHTRLDELLDGFDQLKLDARASDVIAEDIRKATATLYTGQVDVAAETADTHLMSNVLFFGLGFGLAAFAPPGSIIALGPSLGYEMSILLALSLGPLLGFLLALPVIAKAEASARTVVEVLDKLAAAHRDAAGVGGGQFETIELHGVEFRYDSHRDKEAPGFTVGPIDFTLQRGQLIFVTGGNGSGKTTLMKMLLGLYPIHGSILWDGDTLQGNGRRAHYRGLFTAIFGGQFLFDRLYGIDAPIERVEDLLARFGLTGVVPFDGVRFGHLDLSSGQRMRLAMVVALLEDRPICVFDEWTANQDPETTWMYYDTLLPALIAEGKTVIAVSHDDRFFDRADHVLQLDRGQLKSIVARTPISQPAQLESSSTV